MKKLFIDIKPEEIRIDWTQLPAGTQLTKFISVDEGGPDKDYRAVIHGFADKNLNIYVTDILYSTDKLITGKQ